MKTKFLRFLAVPNLHYGFRRSFGIVDNAHRHKKQTYVLNLDIKDYFDQFNFGRVRGFFIKDNAFALDPFIATIIAQISCFDNKLPQGGPCSPHIANLVTQFFDRRMVSYLKEYKCLYTRYADDITISTSISEFPAEVAIALDDAQGWQLSPSLEKVFNKAGFEINPKKSRMSLYDSRQTVTGLTVNSRPNVNRDFYLRTRAMCNTLIRTGSFEIDHFCDDFKDNCEIEKDQKKPAKLPINVLEGRLSHIHYVRERYDRREAKEKREKPTQHWKTMRKFFQYKYFVINALPTVITEGVSDTIYLRLAIRNSKLNLNNLNIETESGKHLGIHLLRHDSIASEILGLTGGAGNIERFLSQYSKEMRSFYVANRVNPTIIVTDNDPGAAKVFGKAKSLFGVVIEAKDPAEVHQIAAQLLLVKTSHIKGKQDTYIEEYLPSSVKDVELNGKKFSPENGADNSKFFGKVALANYVRSNADTIDFSCFDPLVKAIDDAIEKGKK